MESERYQKGVEHRKGLFDRSTIVDRMNQISPDLGRFIVEFAFGDVHSRPGLRVREREIAIIASLTTLGYAKTELKSHIRAALNVGCTREEVLEVIMQMAVYAGIPGRRQCDFRRRRGVRGDRRGVGPFGDTGRNAQARSPASWAGRLAARLLSGVGMRSR